MPNKPTMIAHEDKKKYRVVYPMNFSDTKNPICPKGEFKVFNSKDEIPKECFNNPSYVIEEVKEVTKLQPTHSTKNKKFL